MSIKFVQVYQREEKDFKLAHVKRGVVNDRCTKWKDRVQGVKFECTLAQL